MLNAKAMGLAFGAATAAFWLVCSLLVFVLPATMLNMTGHMTHVNMQDMNWYMPFSGFLFGLVIWSVVAGVFGWLVATFYNRFMKD